MSRKKTNNGAIEIRGTIIYTSLLADHRQNINRDFFYLMQNIFDEYSLLSPKREDLDKISV